VKLPEGVTVATMLRAFSVSQRLPSGPAVIRCGSPELAGRLYSVTVPMVARAVGEGDGGGDGEGDGDGDAAVVSDAMVEGLLTATGVCAAGPHALNQREQQATASQARLMSLQRCG
jgi:hypothetical protein